MVCVQGGFSNYLKAYKQDFGDSPSIVPVNVHIFFQNIARQEEVFSSQIRYELGSRKMEVIKKPSELGIESSESLQGQLHDFLRTQIFFDLKLEPIVKKEGDHFYVYFVPSNNAPKGLLLHNPYLNSDFI